MSSIRAFRRARAREQNDDGTKFDPGWPPGVKAPNPGYYRRILPQHFARKTGTHPQTREFVTHSNGMVRNPEKRAAQEERAFRRKFRIKTKERLAVAS